MATRQRTHLFGYKFVLASIIMFGLAGYASAQPITTLPDNPVVQDLDGAAITQHSSSNFTASYHVSGGDEQGAIVRWDGWATRDLSDVDEFVFGLLGDPNRVRVKFEDTGGEGTASMHVPDFNLSGTIQYFTILANEITIDLEELRAIVFATDQGLAGEGNYEGDFMVYVGGLAYAGPVDPTEAQLTTLPGDPSLFAFPEESAPQVTQHSTTNFSMEYNVVGSYGAVAIEWDAPQDLTGIEEFVFGFMGDLNSVKIEFKSVGGQSDFIRSGITENLQYWIINAAQIAGLDQIEEIVFVMEPGLAGEGNHEGTLEVYVGGLGEPPEPAPEIGPVAPTVAALTILPNKPGIQDLGQTDVALLSSTNILVEYGFPGAVYQGVTVRWTSEFLIQDLSAITQFVFGVRGDIGKLQVEFEYGEGPNSTVILTNVTTSYLHWLIDDDLIRDLEDIKNINFLVTADMVGGNPEGEFHVFVGGLKEPPVNVYKDMGFDPPITVLPGNPGLYDFNSEVGVNPISTTNFMVAYEFDAPGQWRAVGARWSAEFDPYDLSAFSEFVIGVMGDPETVQVEFENADNVKTRFNLVGVEAELWYWHIDASLIDGLDEIIAVTFSVTEDLAGNAEGEFEIHVGGLDYLTPPEDIGPTPPGTAPITVLPGNPPLNGLGDTELNQHSSTNFTVVYDFAERWDGGAYVLWDPPTNLTAITEFVFGLLGDPDTVRVEFEHSTGRTRFDLTGVTNSLQHWHIDASEIDNLDDIKAIVFVVNEDIVGVDGAGEFEVRVGGLDFAGPVDPTQAQITMLPGNPILVGLNDVVIAQHSPTNFSMDYNVTEGWGGVAIQWAEPEDISGIEQFVFGFMGDPNSVKIEFKYDLEGGQTDFIRTGITGDLQYWIISAAAIANLDQIIEIMIVVDPGLAGEGNHEGALEVHVGGFQYQPPPPDPVDPSTAEITMLPGNPDLGGFAGGEVMPHSSTNFTLTYDISGDPDYAGASIQWAAPIDLTTIEEFVFGLMGDPNSVRVEFKAEGDVTTHVILNGVAENLQYWIIDAAHIAGLDQIEEIVFVVDRGLAGEDNYVGSFDVHVGLEEDDPPPVDDPEFDHIGLSPDGTQVLARILASEMGVTYVLQYTTDLTAEPVNWQEADSQSGNGGELTLTDDELGTVGDPVRIYRVIVQ